MRLQGVRLQKLFTVPVNNGTRTARSTIHEQHLKKSSLLPCLWGFQGYIRKGAVNHEETVHSPFMLQKTL